MDHDEESFRPETIPVLRDSLVFRQLDREWVVYDSRGEKLHVLNVTGALLWSYCDGKNDVSSIAEGIAANLSDAPPIEVVRDDVIATLRELRKLDLLR